MFKKKGKKINKIANLFSEGKVKEMSVKMD